MSRITITLAAEPTDPAICTIPMPDERWIVAVRLDGYYATREDAEAVAAVRAKHTTLARED